MIGLAIIARDEEATLPRLLDSIHGAFDRVVLLDTGSEDRTMDVFREWAEAETLKAGGPEDFSWDLGTFEWVHDFAAARNAADELLLIDPDIEWVSWADCDDVLVGADRLRDIAGSMPAEVGAVIFGYDYAQHPMTGECVCTLKRERLVRRAQAGRWEGRVHEAQAVGPVVEVPMTVAHWRHQKQLTEAPSSNERNLDILRRWVQDEPKNGRVLAYLGTELQGRAEHDEAIDWFVRYLQGPLGWIEERVQVCRRLAQSHLFRGELGQAEDLALAAIALKPEWPDSYLTLAEVALERQQWDKALFHADRAGDIGLPDSLLILNPLDYLAHPFRLRAYAHAGMGQWDEALAFARRALEAAPEDEALRHNAHVWDAERKRHHTAETYVLAAEQLIAHDEQLKARDLLRCVPHFAIDHPAIQAVRVKLAQRIGWVDQPADLAEHYEVGGSKPEDFHDDETSARIAEALPRVGFLLDGLAEQQEALRG